VCARACEPPLATRVEPWYVILPPPAAAADHQHQHHEHHHEQHSAKRPPAPSTVPSQRHREDRQHQKSTAISTKGTRTPTGRRAARVAPSRFAKTQALRTWPPYACARQGTCRLCENGETTQQFGWSPNHGDEEAKHQSLLLLFKRVAHGVQVSQLTLTPPDQHQRQHQHQQPAPAPAPAPLALATNTSTGTSTTAVAVCATRRARGHSRHPNSDARQAAAASAAPVDHAFQRQHHLAEPAPPHATHFSVSVSSHTSLVTHSHR
jgi:hypothetical protein